MKTDIYDLIKTALENNHVNVSIKDWPAVVMFAFGRLTYAYVKTLDANAAGSSDDSQQNNWPKAA